jgi:DNA-binding NtrC family response regulator
MTMEAVARDTLQRRENSILFVDDERRVLTSMRAMFRRDYNVLLANSGAEALEIMRAQPVDVVVSDQRMPGMTGVDVLKAVKDMAPGTMRILLTGYADLKAIEDSINDAEVFRYLMKPCPSNELREAVALAASAAATTVDGDAAPPVASTPNMTDDDDELVLLSHEDLRETRPKPAAAAGVEPELVELLVLSRDEVLVRALRDAIGARRKVHNALDVGAAIEILEARPVGVLVTDAAVSDKEVASLTAELKAYVPELVTVVASERSDAQALITMINYGQIFRFLLKPLQVGQTRLWLESAVNKHVELTKNPSQVRRHQVARAAQTASPASGRISGLAGRLGDRLRSIRSRFSLLRGDA